MHVTKQSKSLFDRLLADFPKLHLWNGEFSHGGFDRSVIGSLFWEMLPHLPESPVIIETGAGLSTLAFLAALPSKLVTVSVDPDGGLERRIREWCGANSLPLEALHYINGLSEYHLPGLAFTGLKADVCMMDGGHGWPTVFVDFCYLNMCLKRGGFLVVDDLQLYSVSQLLLLLKHQPGWTLHHRPGPKTIILRKDTDAELLPDFGGQPFIMNNS